MYSFSRSSFATNDLTTLHLIYSSYYKIYKIYRSSLYSSYYRIYRSSLYSSYYRIYRTSLYMLKPPKSSFRHLFYDRHYRYPNSPSNIVISNPIASSLAHWQHKCKKKCTLTLNRISLYRYFNRNIRK